MSSRKHVRSQLFLQNQRDVVRQSVEAAIQERVKALYASRPGLRQHELAEALGVSPSWVSAFLAGRRNANDLPLLVKIARYFGVTVAYLLGESERGRSADATTLLTVFEQELSPPDREAVLQLALMLRRRGNNSVGGGSSAPPGESGPVKKRGK